MSKFCGNCGSMAADEARVCGNCGTPFETPVNNYAEMPQNNYAAPQQSFSQPQYQQSYQPMNMYAPAPAPKKSKKGLIIGVVVAIIAIVVAVIAISGGGIGSSGEKGEKAKNTAESVASQAASYVVKGDADALVNYTSDDFIKYAVNEYGIDTADAKDTLREEYESYTEYVREMKDDGYKVTYKLLDNPEEADSDEIDEFNDVVGSDITEAFLYDAEFYFENDEGYIEEEELQIMVWKNNGNWEFVTLSD